MRYRLLKRSMDWEARKEIGSRTPRPDFEPVGVPREVEAAEDVIESATGVTLDLSFDEPGPSLAGGLGGWITSWFSAPKKVETVEGDAPVEKLREMAARGELRPDDLVLHDGLWLDAKEHPALDGAFGD